MVARNDVDLRVYRRVYMDVFTRANGVDRRRVSRDPPAFRSINQIELWRTLDTRYGNAVKSCKDARISGLYANHRGNLQLMYTLDDEQTNLLEFTDRDASEAR